MTAADTEACIIGAGASGLAAGKALADRGVEFDWFERGSMVGGLWQIDNDNGGAAAYETLHLNSSRPLTQYPSFPMPGDWADYPAHDLIAGYFDDFADRFGLRERITFNTPVERVEPAGDGLWCVTTKHGTKTYRHVLLAGGHHSVPKLPDFPGEFTGTSFHAHDYREPGVFDGKRVLVVGVGNSGMDIACDAAKLAGRVLLSTRHGVHVIPKYVFGRPIDQWGSPLGAFLPFRVERRLYELMLRISTGRPQDRGLPKPDHRLLSAHPSVSSDLYDRVGHGDIEMKPDVARFDGQTVHFTDGTSAEVDVVVYATGYRVDLPYLDRDVYDPAGNTMPLYLRVLTPKLPGLFFVGYIQTVGSGIPLMEHQAEWIGDLITGRCSLPSEREIERWIAADQAAMAARYLRSERHTMQVDFWRYRRALLEARGKGLREVLSA